MNRHPDPLDHLADGLAEDILDTPAERLLAEAAEDHDEPAALAAAFDRLATRAARQARPRRLADRIGALAAMLAPKRSWRPALAAVAGVAVIVVAGDLYWHTGPESELVPASAPAAVARDAAAPNAVAARPVPQPAPERRADAALAPAQPPAPTPSAASPAPAPPAADQPRRVKTVVIGSGGGPLNVAEAPLAGPRPPVTDDRLEALLDADLVRTRDRMAKIASLPPPSEEKAAGPPASRMQPLSRSGVAPQIPAAQSFDWPLRGRLLARFVPPGSRGANNGIDIAAPAGTDVRAAADGVVIYAGGAAKGFGNMILLRHRDGLVTVYGYASRTLVKTGDAVQRGQVIAQSGASGAASEPQLHFEIRRESLPVDPVPLLPPG
ncbi:MAG TPA: M23 family metallopeptidase [Xanthobacteraceae bacterium]|nr:M23 family metallopeptidase [Xanthobacteraceae bacterium]